MPTLTGEDGTGVTGANSYCTLAQADTYHDGLLHVTPWTEADDTTKTRALIWATRLLDENVHWKGARVVTTRDTPAWPRLGTYDTGGILIDSDVVPTCVVEATAELARRLIEQDRVAQAEDPALSISSGGRSRSFGAGRAVPVVPPSITQKLAHLTNTSRLMRVA